MDLNLNLRLLVERDTILNIATSTSSLYSLLVRFQNIIVFLVTSTTF